MSKLLADLGYHGSFECVFVRGIVQITISACFIYFDENRLKDPENSVRLFGPTLWVKFLLFVRAAVGFTSIGFLFVAAPLMPIGDCSVLVMLSPLMASILGYVVLGEPWRIPEFCATVMSLIGAVLVAKPSFIFGESDSHLTSKGVMFALLSACSASCAFISVRMLGTSAKMPWANVSFSQSLGQLFFYFPAILIAGQAPQFPSTLTEVGMIVTISLIGSVSQIIMTIGMQREKSAAATGMRMSDVVFGYIWQSLFTSDTVSLLSVIGALLVSGSIFVIMFFQQKTPPKPMTPVGTGDVEMTTIEDSTSDLKKMSIVADEEGPSTDNPLHRQRDNVGYSAVEQEEEEEDIETGIEIDLSGMAAEIRRHFDENGNIILNEVHSVTPGTERVMQSSLRV